MARVPSRLIQPKRGRRTRTTGGEFRWVIFAKGKSVDLQCCGHRITKRCATCATRAKNTTLLEALEIYISAAATCKGHQPQRATPRLYYADRYSIVSDNIHRPRPFCFEISKMLKSPKIVKNTGKMRKI